ncbi:MAG: hypothetical protein IPN83_00125 [Holophagales bacterium]|nr:hypothetical protein [Holophagales bacterium]
MHRGTEPLLVVADPALSDFLTELYRAARAGAPSPLSVVADKLLDLEEDAA